MSEIAFSIELGRKVSKQEIRNLQSSNKIVDSSAFECPDKNCRVPLSCACWDKSKNFKRKPFFYLSSREYIHSFNCEYVTEKEVAEGIKMELSLITAAQNNNTVIVLENSREYARKEDSSDSKTSRVSNPKRSSNKLNTHTQNSPATRHFRNLASFVSMYYDTDVDNTSPIKLNFQFEPRTPELSVNISNTKMVSTLQNLFCPVQKPINIEEFHIFFGYAKIVKLNDQGLSQVIFTNNDQISLYFNLNSYPNNGFLKKYAG
ncbi:hypothetical protein R4Y59_002698, partial [Enterococcus faecalis]|nr:hypothetical protein [Enterococcus faecalis]